MIKAIRRNIKTERLIVRVSPQLKLQLIKQSSTKGKSLSGYLTSLIEEDLNRKEKP